MQKLLLMAGLLLALGACKKDSGPAAPTRTELLTGKNWLLSAALLNPGITYNGFTITDGYQALSLAFPCQVDNTQRFDLPSVYTISEGANVCAGSSPTSTGTWALSADGNTLTTVMSGTTVTYNVLAITATTLQISSKTILNGMSTTITATFVPK